MRENYIVGYDKVIRGSPDLVGWNMASVYSVTPIIIDDLKRL
jgi:hypothetical protein